MPGKPWTDREIDALKQFADFGVHAVWKVIPTRTPGSIHGKAKELGIKIRRLRGAVWSPDEDATLRALAPRGTRVVKSKLPHRSVDSILSRACRLKVKIARQEVNRPSRRGNMPIPEHAHPLVRQLIAEANDQRAFIDELAKRSGVSKTTISEWRTRRNPQLTALIAVANTLGFDVKLVRQREETVRQPRLEVVK